MKKLVAFLLSAAVSIFSLTGCSGQSPAEGSEPEPISADMLAPEIYDAMREEWASYDALSPEQQMVSSYFPGICHESFSDWADCEEYLGIPVPNPLEEAAWLEHGAHTGESAGSQGAAHVQVVMRGSRNGQVEWLDIRSGYRDGDITVTLDAMLYGASAESTHAARGWSVEAARQFYLANAGSGSVVTAKSSGEHYVSRTAYLARGHALYLVSVTGAPSLESRVVETLDNVLSEFEGL